MVAVEPGRSRMQNADRAVIELITARSANFPVAGAPQDPLTKRHFCTPLCTPQGVQACTPIAHFRRCHATWTASLSLAGTVTGNEMTR